MSWTPCYDCCTRSNGDTVNTSLIDVGLGCQRSYTWNRGQPCVPPGKVSAQQMYEEIFLLSSWDSITSVFWAIGNVLMPNWSVLRDEGRSQAARIPVGKRRSAAVTSPTVSPPTYGTHSHQFDPEAKSASILSCAPLFPRVPQKTQLWSSSSFWRASTEQKMSLLAYLFGIRLLWTWRLAAGGLPYSHRAALNWGGNCKPIEDRQERTGTLQASLACHVPTFAASRHSITLTLKWELAALFASTQLLAITKTAPLGSLTSVALSGLNSISLAYWKKSGRGDSNLLRFRKKCSSFYALIFILRKSSTKMSHLFRHHFLIASHCTRR